MPATIVCLYRFPRSKTDFRLSSIPKRVTRHNASARSDNAKVPSCRRLPPPVTICRDIRKGSNALFCERNPIALVASIPLSDNGPLLAAFGAVVGFIFFFLAYLLGRRLFGPGALGFGDVTMATMMGAMLGFQRIFFALVLGILLAGLWGLIVLLSRRGSRRTYFAYGPFLALGGMVMIIWGNQIYAWFTST